MRTKLINTEQSSVTFAPIDCGGTYVLPNLDQNNCTRIGLATSSYCENIHMLYQLFDFLKNKSGLNIKEIVSMGKPTLFDKEIRKLALELGYEYKEYTPLYLPWSPYSVFPQEKFGKPFKLSEVYLSSLLVAKGSDYTIFIFPKSGDALLKSSMRKAEKLKRKGGFVLW